MKYLLVLLMLPLGIYAQPVLENDYQPYNIYYVSLTDYGDNYFGYNGNEIKIYDDNHNLWKTITIPSYNNTILVG